MRDLPCFEYRTTVIVELYRVRCPDCGVKTERMAQLPSKAPFSKRFEDAVGLACEAGAARQVGRAIGAGADNRRARSTCGTWSRWAAQPASAALAQMGVDEIYLGKKDKFLTVVSNLETGEPLWFGRERKKKRWTILPRRSERRQRQRIEAACVDMWEPFTRASKSGRRNAESSTTSST